jgi:hypothetical protein
MNQPARPAFPASAPSRVARALPPNPPARPGRPVPGPGAPAPRLPQAQPRAPRPPALQRPQVAPPLRPLPRPQAPHNPPPPPHPQAPHNPPTPPRPYAPAASQAAPEQPGPPPRPRKRKIGGWIALLVVAGGLGGAVWFGTQTAPATAGVGDCLAQTGGNELAKVSCNDKSARFRALGKLENKTVVDATLDACKAFPTATSAYWEGESGQRGLVLCLEPVVPAAAK